MGFGGAAPRDHERSFPGPAPTFLPRRARLEPAVRRQGPGPRRRHGLPRPRGLGRAQGEGGGPGKIVADAIKNGDWGDKVVCVRVNDWSTKWTVFDIIEVVGHAGDRLDEIMLPKVENAAQVVAADMVLRQVEIDAGLPIGHVGLEAQIETTHRADQRRGDLRGVAPAGDDHLRAGRLRRVDGDAGAHRRGADRRVPRRPLPLRVQQDPHGRAGQRPPGHRRARTSRSATSTALRDYSQRARILGYDGKWTLHPDQVAGRQRGVHAHPGAVRPRRGDILDAYEQATEGEGKGAVMFGDEMIDEASPQDGDQVRQAGRAGRPVPQPVA